MIAFTAASVLSSVPVSAAAAMACLGKSSAASDAPPASARWDLFCRSASGGWCCYAGLLWSRWSTWSRLGLVCPGSASCLSSEAPAQLCELGAWSLLLFLLLTCSLSGLQLLVLRLGFHSVGLRSCLWRGKLPCLMSALVRLSSGTSCWPRCTLVFSSDLALPQVGGRSR